MKYNVLTPDQAATINKLHIGSGKFIVPGWLNIDIYPDASFLDCPVAKSTVQPLVLNHDIRKTLPELIGKIEFIYSSHFIEHLTLFEGVQFLTDMYSYLQPGGAFRISCPDIELWMDHYTNNDIGFFQKYYNEYHSWAQVPVLSTKAQIFSMMLYSWNHHAVYDFETLSLLLHNAGFNTVLRKKAFESTLPNITILEPSEPGRLLESLYIEAYK